MKHEMRRRVYRAPLARVEDGRRKLRDLSGLRDSDIVMTGYAVKWDDRYEWRPGYVERFERGAFEDAMGEVRFLVEHGGLALAREDAGTVDLREDEVGLAVTVALDARDSMAADLAVRVDRGAVQGLSVGFSMGGGEENWAYTDDGAEVTIVKVGRLWEFSAVSFPAYEESEILTNAMPTTTATEASAHSIGAFHYGHVHDSTAVDSASPNGNAERWIDFGIRRGWIDLARPEANAPIFANGVDSALASDNAPDDIDDEEPEVYLDEARIKRLRETMIRSVE